MQLASTTAFLADLITCIAGLLSQLPQPAAAARAAATVGNRYLTVLARPAQVLPDINLFVLASVHNAVRCGTEQPATA
jgi:hypothetical protein